MELNKSLKEIINLQYHSTDLSVVSVGLGKKIKNGIETNETAIVYGVKKKIPSAQIPSEQLLPKNLIVDGQLISTDVVEVGKIRFVAGCWGSWRYTDSNNDGVFDGVSETITNSSQVTPHRSLTRPIKGGVSIFNLAEKGYTINGNVTTSLGTLGLICVDNDTNTLVGITNNHVLIRNAFIASERVSTASAWNTTMGQTLGSVFVENGNIQMTESEFSLGITNAITNTVGKIKKYWPITALSNNYIDVAVTTLNSSAINYAESFKQVGVPYNTPMPFATTAEIDSLLTSDPDLISAGRTTGPKGITTSCRLKTAGVGASVLIENIEYDKYDSPGGGALIDFTDIISFNYRSTSVDTPIFGGDSGSALIANFNGIYKIIGLVFAGNISTEGTNKGICTLGFACRIDRIASSMNLRAWDGTIIPVDTFSDYNIQYVDGLNADRTKTINNKKYWQIGTA